MHKIKQIPEDFIVEEIPLFDFEDKGRYTYFLLEKRNYNTEKAIRKIADFVNIPRKKFGYAGNKDKRAITRQYCSVLGKLRNLEIKDIKVTVKGKGNEPISLGDLQGNRFKITIRDIEKKPEKTEQIINYFDEQRFGSTNVDVGLAILKKEFEKAVKLTENNNALEHLEKHPNDYIGALKNIPFNILRLYINSVQSWLWNQAVVEYVKKNSTEFKTVHYSKGEFVFPFTKIENIELPFITFDTEFKNEFYEKILADSEISKRDFVIRSIPALTPMGGKRDIVAPVKNMRIGKLENNDLGERKKIEIEFELDKGCYATIVLKKIL